ncbi:MAG: WXG100 family type VII secretion target [Acetatifactor sp.]|nr:WXG100 family type VII secretion target [Acetatifactor sp.]
MTGWNTDVATGFGGPVSFRVTPDVLKSKSVDVSRSVSRMRGHFEELKNLLEKTGGYWIGEAGEKHRQMYKDIEDSVEEMLKRLGEYPMDLLEIAQNYTDADLSIEEDIAALPDNVIG